MDESVAADPIATMLFNIDAEPLVPPETILTIIENLIGMDPKVDGAARVALNSINHVGGLNSGHMAVGKFEAMLGPSLDLASWCDRARKIATNMANQRAKKNPDCHYPGMVPPLAVVQKLQRLGLVDGVLLFNSHANPVKACNLRYFVKRHRERVRVFADKNKCKLSEGTVGRGNNTRIYWSVDMILESLAIEIAGILCSHHLTPAKIRNLKKEVDDMDLVKLSKLFDTAKTRMNAVPAAVGMDIQDSLSSFANDEVLAKHGDNVLISHLGVFAEKYSKFALVQMNTWRLLKKMNELVQSSKGSLDIANELEHTKNEIRALKRKDAEMERKLKVLKEKERKACNEVRLQNRDIHKLHDIVEEKTTTISRLKAHVKTQKAQMLRVIEKSARIEREGSAKRAKVAA